MTVMISSIIYHHSLQGFMVWCQTVSSRKDTIKKDKGKWLTSTTKIAIKALYSYD